MMRIWLSMCALALIAGGARAEDWPPASRYLAFGLNCSQSQESDQCLYAVVTWPMEYANAVAGKYQGQRNVSYCLSTGCSGAVEKNPMLGCAWRIVIIESGHFELDSTDTANLNYFCGNELVDDEGRQAAKAQARRMLAMLGVKTGN